MTPLAPIPSAPGYFASEEGDIYSAVYLWLSVKNQLRRLTPAMGTTGYLFVTLRVGGKSVQRMVHTLLLEAFTGQRSTSENQARHLDGDRFNNRLGNLAFGTRIENAADREAHGRTRHGESHYAARLTAALVMQARARVAAGETIAAIARDIGAHAETLRAAVKGRTWKHVGRPECIQ